MGGNREEDQTGWSRAHRIQHHDEMRVRAIKHDLGWLEMTEEQYQTALGHPIFMEVLQLAVTANPPISFWVAQYRWLGLELESIDRSGHVLVEFQHPTFAEERALYLEIKNTT